MSAVLCIPATLGVGLVWAYRVTFGALFPSTCKYHPSCSEYAVQAVKRAVQLGEGEPVEQAIAIMMDAHWRSAVHPDRVEGIGAFNDGRDPTFRDSDY